jgi:hypothetical protein
MLQLGHIPLLRSILMLFHKSFYLFTKNNKEMQVNIYFRYSSEYATGLLPPGQDKQAEKEEAPSTEL